MTTKDEVSFVGPDNPSNDNINFEGGSSDDELN